MWTRMVRPALPPVTAAVIGMPATARTERTACSFRRPMSSVPLAPVANICAPPTSTADRRGFEAPRAVTCRISSGTAVSANLPATVVPSRDSGRTTWARRAVSVETYMSWTTSSSSLAMARWNAP